MKWTKIIILTLVAYALYTTFVVREGFGSTEDIITVVLGIVSFVVFLYLLAYPFLGSSS